MKAFRIRKMEQPVTDAWLNCPAAPVAPPQQTRYQMVDPAGAGDRAPYPVPPSFYLRTTAAMARRR